MARAGRDAVRLDRALDRFIGDMARRNCSSRSRDDYFGMLCRLFMHLPADALTSDLTLDVLRDCLDEWSARQPNTRYKVDAIFRAFLQVALSERAHRPEPTRPAASATEDSSGRPAPAMGDRRSSAETVRRLRDLAGASLPSHVRVFRCAKSGGVEAPLAGHRS